MIDIEINQEYKEKFKEYGKPMIIPSIFGSLIYNADKLIIGIFIGVYALVTTTIISPWFSFIINIVATVSNLVINIITVVF